MSFNVSRFLVRVRQFWTRERLVPVLGLTALFLFGLNFYQFLHAKFADDPIIARHVVINGITLDSETSQFDRDVEYFFRQFDHGDHEKRWHHKKWRLEQGDQEFEFSYNHPRWEADSDHKRKIFELKEKIKNHQRLEIKNKILRFHSDDDGNVIILKDRDDDDDVIIMNEHNGESFEITINGKKIEIKQTEEI